MALPTGTIYLSQVNEELGRASNTKISLNDADVRSIAGKPSGTISMNDLRGKSADAWRYTGFKIPLPYSLSANGSTQGIALSATSDNMYFAVIDSLNGNARIYGLDLNGQVSLGYTTLPSANVTGVEVYNGRLYFTEDLGGHELKSVVPSDPGSVRSEFALGITDPFDIGRDNDGYWYAVDRASNKVHRYYPNGTKHSSWTPAGCLYPLGCGGNSFSQGGIWVGDGQSGNSSVGWYSGAGAVLVEQFNVADTVNTLTGVTHDPNRNCVWVCGTKELAIYQYKEN